MMENLISGCWRQCPRQTLLDLVYEHHDPEAHPNFRRIAFRDWMTTDLASETIGKLMTWALAIFNAAGVEPKYDLALYSKIEKPGIDPHLLFPTGDDAFILLTLAPSEAPNSYAFWRGGEEPLYEWQPGECDFVVAHKDDSIGVIRNDHELNRVYLIITLEQP